MSARSTATELLIDLASDNDLRPLDTFDPTGLKALISAIDVAESA